MSQQPNVIRRCVEVFADGRVFTGGCGSAVCHTSSGSFAGVVVSLRKAAGPGQDLRAIFDAMTFNDKLELIALFFLWVTVPFAVAGRGLGRVASEQIANREISFRDAIEEMAPSYRRHFCWERSQAQCHSSGLACWLFRVSWPPRRFRLSFLRRRSKNRAFTALRRGLSRVGRVFGRSFCCSLVTVFLFSQL